MNKFSACFFMIVLFAACNKREPAPMKEAAVPAKEKEAPEKIIITDKLTKAGEDGPVLPAGTKLVTAADGYSIDVELPAGYTFVENGPVTNSTQPVGFATYRCICSGAGSACQVFYSDGGGFGCFHSSCTGSCEGAFSYKGYVVNRILPTAKTDLFADAGVQSSIAAQFAIVRRSDGASRSAKGKMVYVKQSLYGVAYYFLMNENELRPDAVFEVFASSKAVCDCEGTKACTLKTMAFATDKSAAAATAGKIYYCDGPCNGCELTVN